MLTPVVDVARGPLNRSFQAIAGTLVKQDRPTAYERCVSIICIRYPAQANVVVVVSGRYPLLVTLFFQIIIARYRIFFLYSIALLCDNVECIGTIGAFPTIASDNRKLYAPFCYSCRMFFPIFSKTTCRLQVARWNEEMTTWYR